MHTVGRLVVCYNDSRPDPKALNPLIPTAYNTKAKWSDSESHECFRIGLFIQFASNSSDIKQHDKKMGRFISSKADCRIVRRRFQT